ncbi:hypothetical protein GQX74_013441 [Glossina fuscipes]|nr:hypothetical protein GQX74_013441 [Glossina fuscipes]
MSPSGHTALYALAIWIWQIKCHCDRLELCLLHDAARFLQGYPQTKATLNSLKHDVFICSSRDSIIRFSVKATNNNNHNNNNNTNNKSHKSKRATVRFL